MAPMTTDETWDFLMAGTRTAHVATVRADGRPHVKPVWFELTGPATGFRVLFTTSAETVAGRNLSRDNRVAFTADDPVPPYSFVLIEGTAELSSDPGELLRWRPGWAAGTWARGARRSSASGTRSRGN
ncbi:MAG: TIGR03618 family F420-dependent PPOX class oxidoreductase [Streptosporangiales bacterium]